ncbi:MAG: prolipoprotein diacylglyceryl transferase [Chloroflexota bacterium]
MGFPPSPPSGRGDGQNTVTVPVLLASIPSPSSGTLDLGPVSIHMYGIMLLVGIAAAIGLAGLRWTRQGGDWDLVMRVAVWGVAAGVVGARLYHVITSYDQLPDAWWGPFAVWKGGLGVWGGILFGAVAGALVARRAGVSVAAFADAAAPAILLAQGIGRWGNWWNQELFGKPSDLPWALEIDPVHRPAGYELAATFHPIFLYEFLFDLAGVAILLLVARRFAIRPPGLFALYVSYYTLGRLFEEQLRIDPSGHFLGQRVNFWVALVTFLASTSFFVWRQFLGGRRIRPAPERPSAKGRAMAVPRGRVRPRR